MMNDREALFGKFFARELTAAIAFIAFALLLAGYVPYSVAQQQGQRTFASADDAARAIFAAMQTPDDQAALSILGPAAKDVLLSGDTAEDADARSSFVVKYQEMHRLVTEPNGTVALVIGAENWPFPIPLANNHGSWYFDTPAGKDEIIFRRVGKNELTAMDACRELVEAEKQYFARPPAGVTKQFAQNLVSDPGRHNGLYWREASDEFDSPIDPLIASAGQESAKSGDDTYASARIPFNGYYFRILTGQGRNAPGGARGYIVNGKMDGGFAFVAYPAEYRSSGVMTFIVNESGVVYEKDLGPNTSILATTMTNYNPDSTWHQVD